MIKKHSIQKRALVLWSGGLDSTALICRYLDQGWAVDALPIDFKNTFEKLKRERLARTAMYESYFNEKAVTLLEAVSIDIPLLGSSIFSQAPIWINSALMSVMPSRHDEVAMAYVMGDDAISYLDDFRRIWRANAFLFKRGQETLPPLKFPLSKSSKNDLIHAMPYNLVRHLTWCENHLTADFCGTCVPCKKAKFLQIEEVVRRAISEAVPVKQIRPSPKILETIAEAL